MSIRYGWFSLAELEAGVSEISLTHFENCLIPEDIHAKSPSEACVQKDGNSLSSCAPEQHPCGSKDQSALLLAMPSSTGKSAQVPEQCIDVLPSQFGRQNQDQVTTNQVFEVLQFCAYFCQVNIPVIIVYLLIVSVLQVDQGMDCAAVSEGEWADTLTDISVGYLLTEASRGANTDCPGTSVVKNTLLLENPCSYDSFDAAVALHASRYKSAEQPALASHSTIWGAEETCDAFSFNLPASRKREGSNNSASSSPDSDSDVHPSNSEGFQCFLQVCSIY